MKTLEETLGSTKSQDAFKALLNIEDCLHNNS